MNHGAPTRTRVPCKGPLPSFRVIYHASPLFRDGHYDLCGKDVPRPYGVTAIRGIS